jgi:Fe-S cluster assembly iron-binding protein IscA
MNITPGAKEKLKEFLQDNDGSFVRVAKISCGAGCGAKTSLGVTLDEDKNEADDLAFTFDALTVVVEKELYASLKEPVIDFDADKGITVSIK